MDTEEITWISINIVTLTISLPGNIFIIVVNIVDFFKNRRLLLSDQLIFGFSMVNILHALQKWNILYKDLFHVVKNEYDKKAIYVFMYLNMCTLWFSTLLILHFCLKIVNINHRFYICLQRRFPKLFPWIIITFILGYFFLSLGSALDTNQECFLNKTFSAMDLPDSPRCYWPFLIFLIICGLCSLFCSVSAMTIIISLLKHLNRIQKNTESSRSPNMESHIRAVRTVTTLLAANILMFSSVFTVTMITPKAIYPFGIVISICHTFSSYFLIKGTRKLDKTLEHFLNHCSSSKNQW
ncbi:hypothetical protein GDO78_018568 [Eleutherodactylus coqui]|uniref:Taste receptor type 2 n=1 Tax=Eleutherodactylus coqui TaxID=57060 RepID=A0A8J6ECK9_ELECQ|nr:hypothetical protein GDO78_018568 [Eleutherodactylus coqui]